MRLSAILWPFTFGTRLSCVTTAVPNPAPDAVRGHAFLLRGNAVVFSRGFGTLCDELRRAGFAAEDLRCVGHRWVCQHLLAERAAGRLHGPVVLVGHSCGGRYALHAAADLERASLSIDLIVCIDVAFPPPVSANVRRAVHIYRSRRRIYPARPLRLAPTATCRIENVDLDAPGSPIDPRGLYHLNITGSPAVRALVRERILETLAET